MLWDLSRQVGNWPGLKVKNDKEKEALLTVSSETSFTRVNGGFDTIAVCRQKSANHRAFIYFNEEIKYIRQRLSV